MLGTIEEPERIFDKDCEHEGGEQIGAAGYINIFVIGLCLMRSHALPSLKRIC